MAHVDVAAHYPLGEGLYLDDPRLLIAGGVFAGCLLVGAIVIAVVKRWRKKQERVTPSASDQLNEYRALFEEGDLSKEEFERIRGRLLERMRKETGLGAKLAQKDLPTGATSAEA